MLDRQVRSFSQRSEKITLTIKTPRIVEDSARRFESFFKEVHKLTQGQKGLSIQEKTVSFELVLKENFFHYRIIALPKIAQVITSLLYAQFPDAEVLQEPFVKETTQNQYIASEFKLKRSNNFPLKTEFSGDDDPYLVLSAILSKLEHFKEELIVQFVLYSHKESWLEKFEHENFSFAQVTGNKIKLFIEKPFLQLNQIDYSHELRKKFEREVFRVSMRVLISGTDAQMLKENFQLILKALEKYDKGGEETYKGIINKLVRSNIKSAVVLNSFLQRILSKQTMILNTQELAALFHFPDSSLGITSVDHIRSKKIDPPKEIPLGTLFQTPDISIFGKTTSRGTRLEFGIKRIDRPRHLYIIGKTGMGKSKLITLLAASDILQNKGLCVVDPHGDLATELLRYIPKERVQDVIYFSPADSEYPIGFNPIECFTSEAKHQVVTGFIAIFKKLFASNWTNRLEHVLRFTVLALIEAGDSTILDIVSLLTDIEFRQQVVKKIHDPVVKNFWTHEFSAWNEKFDNEAIIPIINQVGQFIANDYIRNVVGQKKSSIDFYTAMNEGKILIINLAKGKLGEENSALLGSMIITKIQEAAMARVNIPHDQRREFYLYVDEFQNFATEAFNQILSEARKFNLSLTIAHQYIDQLSENIRKTAFGNVGSLICFRVGSDDAHYLSNEFAPHFTPEDLVNLDARHMYIKLSIDGKTSESFSAETLDVPTLQNDNTSEIIEYSRANYAVSKKSIEEELYGQQNTQEILPQEGGVKEESAFDEPLIN